MSANDDPRPFLTLIATPDGMDRESVAQLLADHVGLDEPTIQLVLRRDPPLIIGQFSPARAMRAVETIRAHGGDAFAPTLANLATLGATMKVKDLRLEGGAIAVDLWRGPTTTIRREDVEILVRARLSEKVKDYDPGALSGRFSAGLATPFGGTGILMASGAAGLALHVGAGYQAAIEGWYSVKDERIETSDKLDIHTQQGLVFQIDGDKFAYHILGDQRGYGDNYNMDQMCDLLAHVCPNEIVDPFFSLWKPPSGHERLRLMPRDDSRAFAFYSRWTALLYRHLKSSA